MTSDYAAARLTTSQPGTRQAASRVAAPNRAFSLYISAVVFLSFFTYSVHTPLGFMSFEDIAIGLAVFCFGLSSIGGRAIRLPNLPVIFLSGITFFLIVFSTVIANKGLDISPVVKYWIFLIAIPTSFCLAGYAPSDIQYLKILRIFVHSGNAFLVFVVVSLLLGLHTGTGENYQIVLFGQGIYKNAVGSYLLYCAVPNFIQFCISRRTINLFAYLLALACCLFLNVRGPIITGLLLSAIIYWRFIGITVQSLLRLAAFFCCVAVIGYLIYISGLADQQFHRLFGADTLASHPTVVGSNQSRIILWKYSLSLIGQSPYFGIGYGGFFYDQSRDWMYGLREPHDNILQILSEGGAVGFMAFLSLLIAGFRAGASNRFSLAFKLIAVSYLVHTLVDIIWARGAGHLFWIVFYLFALSPEPLRGARPVRLQRSLHPQPTIFPGEFLENSQ